MMTHTPKTVGIIGGMGPMACVDLFSKIVRLTKADKDNDHLRIYIDNNTTIPDRTAYILGNGPSPLSNLIDSIDKLTTCGASCIVIPCNTAHYFYKELVTYSRIPVLSILDAAAGACSKKTGKPAILGTKGTLQSGLYQQALTSRGIEYLMPSSEQQDVLMSVIYNGVKAGAKPEAYGEDLLRVFAELSANGADYFVLGCTELPLAVEAVNPPYDCVSATLELAKAAIQFCGYLVKQD
eukprot:Blabericola_migrator_1__1053@NODE_1269_length_4935_cov_145_462818_g856_i0_p4_GENE_NODE_1269_length_4935_cov_145_462818_g856_i0NODE_1269_length_4935_cov_145_462818_g856_i0_p4_ORF_typecomplete_len238_score30_09Asp_Glu_race/PF01177_22/1_8e47Cyclotide/PF03784_13/0_025AroM/PF07302_11/4_3e02AroM/PF07302_11/0_38MAF_flag10/PF01973_18/0_15_NODE_1269_length_4935_cov_145_462818_g856_i010631776